MMSVLKSKAYGVYEMRHDLFERVHQINRTYVINCGHEMPILRQSERATT
jgi:hypothetical protein